MMNEKDMKSVKHILENTRQKLIRDICVDKGKLQAYSVINPDPSDLADKSIYQEKVSTRLILMNKRLTLIEAALNRLDEGAYGVCSECGGEINPERLKILPYTTVCVKCKAKLEALHN